jgi:glycerophosphoryl diester phosphodiesterase
VLSSFSIAALEAARAVAPELPRGLLVDEIPADWDETLKRLKCVALHCDHEKLTEEKAAAVRGAGYALLCWTVNDAIAARRLLGWGVDCLVTDALRTITADFT